ncbi:MAG TPA: DUF4350 domain-containing protein [Gemmatimonadales bacterium]|nr:DUF4350 domain-containing protein [Gemmatimonadales bacterium]
MSRRPELTALVLFGLVVAGAVVAGLRSNHRGREGEPPSTFFAGPDGSKAIYDVLVRLGRPAERRRTPLYDLTQGRRAAPALLVEADPPDELTAAELEQVVRYVQGGGAVLAVGAAGGITRCAGWAVQGPGPYATESLPVQQPGPGLELPPARAVLRPFDSLPDSGSLTQRLRRELNRESSCGALGQAVVDTLLRTEQGKPVVVRLRARGGGRLTLVADDGYVRNRVWRTTDVPYFVLPLLTPPRPGRVTWDEYHQGFGRSGSLVGALLAWLTTAPAGWAVLQLLAVSLVALAVAAVRFGPPRAVVERRRRSPLEHLEALAAGLEGAGGVDTAVALTVAGLRRRLGRAAALAPEAQRAWLAALELALPTAAGRTAVRRLQQAINQPGGPERALAAAQAVEDVWQELRPPTTRAAS